MAAQGPHLGWILATTSLLTVGLLLVPQAADGVVTPIPSRTYSAPFKGTSSTTLSHYRFGCGLTSYAFLASNPLNLTTGIGHMGSRTNASDFGVGRCATGPIDTASNGTSQVSYFSKGLLLSGALSVKVTWDAEWTINASLNGSAGGFAEIYPVAFLVNSTNGLNPLSVTAGTDPGGDFVGIYNQTILHHQRGVWNLWFNESFSAASPYTLETSILTFADIYLSSQNDFGFVETNAATHGNFVKLVSITIS